MKKFLRKSDTRISVYYDSGNYSHNMHGRNIAIDTGDSRNLVFIDLSKNYRSRNKESNSYLDIIEIQEDADDLTSITIHEEKLIEPIGREMESKTTNKWKIELNLGGGKIRIFSVVPKLEDFAVTFELKRA